MPFITAENGTLKVSDEARQYLAAVPGTVGVCCVAGVYRTGKSYILNCLAGKDAAGQTTLAQRSGGGLGAGTAGARASASALSASR